LPPLTHNSHFLSLLAFLTRFLPYIIPLFLSLFVQNSGADAQSYKIKGIVYDSTRSYPIEAVSVLTSSGRGTATNSDGYYEIEVTEKDSIWFSYLNKPTMKFPVLKINNPLAFDISLHVNVPVLKEVKIRPRNYRLDSIQNREDYAKIFNYQKPKLKPITPGYGAAAGFDLEQVIKMFQFRRNRSTAAFQKRLLSQEQDRFIDHRFTKNLVRRLTQLDGNTLDSFMRIFRPSYSFSLVASDYEFQQYIRNAFFRFQKGLRPESILQEDEFD
jgi:hypothetical protein